MFAEAQVDINRIRRARQEVFSRGMVHPGHESEGGQKDNPAATCLEEESAAERFAVNLSDQVRQLARLDRYERRALSLRKFATRAFDSVFVEAK